MIGKRYPVFELIPCVAVGRVDISAENIFGNVIGVGFLNGRGISMELIAAPEISAVPILFGMFA